MRWLLPLLPVLPNRRVTTYLCADVFDQLDSCFAGKLLQCKENMAVKEGAKLKMRLTTLKSLYRNGEGSKGCKAIATLTREYAAMCLLALCK